MFKPNPNQPHLPPNPQMIHSQMRTPSLPTVPPSGGGTPAMFQGQNMFVPSSMMNYSGYGPMPPPPTQPQSQVPKPMNVISQNSGYFHPT